MYFNLCKFFNHTMTEIVLVFSKNKIYIIRLVYNFLNGINLHDCFIIIKQNSNRVNRCYYNSFETIYSSWFYALILYQGYICYMCDVLKCLNEVFKEDF